MCLRMCLLFACFYLHVLCVRLTCFLIKGHLLTYVWKLSYNTRDATSSRSHIIQTSEVIGINNNDSRGRHEAVTHTVVGGAGGSLTFATSSSDIYCIHTSYGQLRRLVGIRSSWQRLNARIVIAASYVQEFQVRQRYVFVQEAQLPQRDRATRYVSKLVLCFTS